MSALTWTICIAMNADTTTSSTTMSVCDTAERDIVCYLCEVFLFCFSFERIENSESESQEPRGFLTWIAFLRSLPILLSRASSSHQQGGGLEIVGQSSPELATLVATRSCSWIRVIGTSQDQTFVDPDPSVSERGALDAV